MFRPSQSHHTEFPVVSSFSKDYSVGDAGGSSFGVKTDNFIGGVVLRTTHCTSQNVDLLDWWWLFCVIYK